MKWIYIIRQKLKAAIALGIIFLLILITNMMDKNHYAQLGTSFSSVYEDRLLVESYIYKLSTQLNKKKELLDTLSERDYSSIGTITKDKNDSIRKLISSYERTKLTEVESDVFHDLKQGLEELSVLESDYYQKPGKNAELYKKKLDEKYKEIALNLDKLSEIQVSEGENLINRSKRIIAESNMTSHLEVCMLIVIGLVVQALIFASKSIRPKLPQNPNLN